MGIWVRPLRIKGDERLIWQVPCNWEQGGAARGGRLGVTSQALIFEPNRIDALTGGKSRRLPLSDIQSVEVEPGGRPSFSGGLRRRLRVNLRDGTYELLLVNNLGARLADIQAAVAGAR